MKKKLLVLLVAICFNLPLFAQTISIGTSNATVYSIFNMEDSCTHHADIYTATEIGKSGIITNLGWNINKVWNNVNGPVKIYLKQIPDFNLISDTWANEISGATLVFDNTITFPTSANNTWFPINLSTPFYYDSTSGNLLVLVESNYGGSGNGNLGGDIDFNSTSNIGQKSELWWGDPVQINGTVSTTRPVIQITFNITNGLIATNSNNNLALIYPNPFSDRATVCFSDADHLPFNIEIFDALGKIVREEKQITGNDFVIEKGQLQPGVYTLRIYNEKQSIIKQVIVK